MLTGNKLKTFLKTWANLSYKEGKCMPTSIWSPEVQTVFDQARVPGTRRVQVGDQSIEIPSPFPSPEDWRVRWIFFIMVDRLNNSRAPPRHSPCDSEHSDFQS